MKEEYGNQNKWWDLMYSQILIARNYKFPPYPGSENNHQARAITSRILESLSLHPCDCAYIIPGKSLWHQPPLGKCG